MYEVGAFRRVRRTWEQFFSGQAASNAEHTFRVMWTSLMIANMEKAAGTEVDQEKMLKMALLHDLPESRTGDTNYITRQYVKQDETKAVKDIFQDTELRREFTALWKEYVKRKSLESRIVKDADILDVDLELAEMAAEDHDLPKHFRPHRKLNYEKMLYTKSAKKLWQEIQTASPYDWHLKGRNRFNGGDWAKHKKKK